MKITQKVGIILAAVILGGTFFIPTTQTFSPEARSTMAIVLVVIILLVTEAIPIGITCMMGMAMLVALGAVPSMGVALSGFANPILFFVLVSFGISAALVKTPLSKRILVLVARKFGQSSRRLLFAIMFSACLISFVISSVAAVAVFIPVVLNFLNVYNTEEERRSTGKCFMMALPIATMIGGMMTPASSSINMIAISMLEEHTGLTIRFIDWMCFSAPVILVMLPFAWFICWTIYPPADVNQQKIKDYISSIEIDSKLSGQEIYVLAVIFSIVLFWILSSWFPIFNITLVGLLGLMFFFIPSKEVLTWREFVSSVSWEVYILIGAMISLGAAVSSSGLSIWVATMIFPNQLNLPLFLLVAFVASITFMLLLPIPVAPALVTMLAPPLMMFAESVGVSPYFFVLVLALTATQCYFFPLDAVPLMTFSKGYYKMFDLPKVAIPIQLLFTVAISIWLPVMGKVLGVI